MKYESGLPKPYKTGISAGIPVVKQLLRPAVKEIVDTMHRLKGSYVGVSDDMGILYVDGNPQLKISPEYLDDLQKVLNDQRHYEDMSEYRLTEERYKHILIYYS